MSSEQTVSMESIDGLLKQIWKSVRGDAHAISSTAKMSKVDDIKDIMKEKFLNKEWLDSQKLVTGNIEVKPYVSAPLMKGSSIPQHVVKDIQNDMHVATQFIEAFLPKMMKFMHEANAAFPEPDRKEAGNERPKVTKQEIMASHVYSIIDVEPPVGHMLGNLQFDQHHTAAKMYYSTAIPVKYMRPMTKEEMKLAAQVIIDLAEYIEHFDKGIHDKMKSLKDRGLKMEFIERVWLQFDRMYGILNHLWDVAKALNIWMSKSIED